MGLVVATAYLADMKRADAEGVDQIQVELEDIYAVLKLNGLPIFREPEKLSVAKRACAKDFPYSFLHYLRRAYAFIFEYPDEPLEPVGPGGVDADSSVVEDAASMLMSHLLCHSDCDGWYVPVDFKDPIVASDEAPVPGNTLGSSYGLARELTALAPYLSIRLQTDDTLSDAEAARIHAIGVGDEGPFHRELTAWLALWEAARVSVVHKTAIRFA